MSINRNPIYSFGDYSYSLLIVLMLLGYPIFSIFASILNQDFMTLLYRGLCIVVGLSATILSSSVLHNKLSFTRTQIIIIGLHFVYICWVSFYFAMGYHNETLDISFYINNSVFFSLIPILLVNRNINAQFFPLIKRQLRVAIFCLIIIIFYAYKLGLSPR